MEINKHIIDQRITKIVSDNPDWFANLGDDRRKKSKAYVILTVATYLGIELEDANSLITEGSQDAGVDAIYIGDLNDYEFPVTIFQGKYVFDLNKESNFPANGIQRVVGAVASIFDPYKPVLLNDDLKPKVQEIRSLISDGYIPTVRCVCANNGLTWTQEGENHIKNAGFPANQVQFDHFNHDDIVQLIQNKKGIKTTLHFSGKSIVDDFNYKRVLLGKVNVVEFAQLFENHGDVLLEKNIRRYLGLTKNRVNESIQDTLIGDKKDNFYFYNNGVTIVCSKFSYNALQGGDWNVTIEDLQIINGGQSCKTIQQTIHNHPSLDYSQVFVLVRLYELSGKDIDDLITDITIATNSQNPVDLRDLRANDERQRKLELDIKELGYTYKRKKDAALNGDIIPSSVVAEAVFTIWKRKPHLAKFKRTELFGKYYDDVFVNLNSAQAIIAVLIYRYCDNQRRKFKLYVKHPHLPFSNYFIAMVIGELTLLDCNIKLNELTHANFIKVKDYFEHNKETLFERANVIVEKALEFLYPDGLVNIEPRRLSAFFRRGELLDYIDSHRAGVDENTASSLKKGERNVFPKDASVSDKVFEKQHNSAVTDTDLFVKAEGKIEKIKLESIIYIEGAKDYVFIHLEGGRVIHFLSTMKDLEAKLTANKFIRCHRSYFVNLNKISNLEDGNNIIRIDNGETSKLIPVGKQYKAKVMDFVNSKRL